jgi:hypothetical protein
MPAVFFPYRFLYDFLSVHKCKLSEVYTNHSITATGATILAKNMYGNAQIMTVTGHKSVQALSMYQRVDDEDEIR